MGLFGRLKNGRKKVQPTQRYHDLIDMYKTMHESGVPDQGKEAEQTFNGHSILRHTSTLRTIASILMPESLLDYGSGKGHAYTHPEAISLESGESMNLKTYLGLNNVVCFDPAHTPYDQKPTGQFDGVVCCDVLEHCPEEDMDWILDEIFSYARHFVFLTIAGYEATKHLPNGENAHITIKPLSWWNDRLKKIAANHQGLRYFAIYDAKKPVGTEQSFIRAYSK